ncbi:MAG: F0F1 ATP synthase subunit B [Acidimicrobiales bacterium]|nr:F0F1 ATP synthase subunit B [Acidimicrobiales bacterium]MCB1259189.1 F0F1 ATP synthase subunit B [Acidimicrobiales bacterium]
MNIAILAAEGGHAANNWFFGDIKEVIVTGLASIILFGLLWWKGGPALKDMWNGRINRIADEVTDAEAARADAERALGEAQGRVADLDTEKARLLSEARATAEAVKAQIIARAEEEAAALVERARTDALAAREQAATDLQAEIAGLALGAAEAIVHDSLDDATQAALVDSYIAGVSA